MRAAVEAQYLIPVMLHTFALDDKKMSLAIYLKNYTEALTNDVNNQFKMLNELNMKQSAQEVIYD